jgi:Flp pilus assembly protein TadG
MASKIETNNTQGVLARLLRDQSGNALAMMAASVLPIIGIVGGAVDMGRMYAVKTRLQAACDAGVVAGRKVMGTGDWVGNTAANNAANTMFSLNFANNLYGSKNLTKTFEEKLDASNQPIDGALGGTASADVPQTLMRVFGQFNETITVNCTSEMKIPHTDVMFVLDTTGSMNCAPGDGLTCSNNGGVEKATAKMKGIRLAAKCFYEALARENIDDVTSSQCYQTSDPSGGLSTITQLRFGFVPYAQTVNAIRLLPNEMVADQALYQSRTPNLQTIQTWSTGTAGAVSGFSGAWTPASPPNSPFATKSNYPSSGATSWTVITPSTVSTLQGTLNRQVTGKNSTTCPQLNKLTSSGGGTNQLVALSEATGGSISSPIAGTTTNTTPVYPTSSQVTSYTQTQPYTVKGYSYTWGTVSSVTSCWLSVATNASQYNKTQSGGTSSRPIIWTPYQRVNSWTYQPVMINISGFKGGVDGNGKPVYNPTITLPINETNSPSVKESGSSTSGTLKILANKTINFQPCVEEVATFRNTDGDPSNEWNPIPAAATDMDIDHLPNTGDNTTRWRPMLPDAVWGRPNMGIGTGDVNYGQYLSGSTYYHYYNATCDAASATSRTAAARKMAAYRGATGSASFKSYLNSLAAGGGTHHDIGLLWGARLMSPEGIFASENATTPSGAEISRHMVFMTDGKTSTWGSDYTAYGIDRWDHRQTNNATDLGTGPADAGATLLGDLNNYRQLALCNAIKAKQITLWVVYYGDADLTTETRMKSCASSAKHYFEATSTQVLIETFNKIASSISELKLTV